ncbi:MAG: radical SAM protein [Deltaproteobacteria bacterium]|nr:radical SAM protein [Deltaproteobacteria bacterium]
MRERGAIIKERQRHLHTGLIFPGTYELAMSSLAYQHLYYVLNNMDRILCDRFVPDREKSLEHKITTQEIRAAFITAPFILSTNTLINYCRTSLTPFSSVICIGGAAAAANPCLFRDCEALIFPGPIEEHISHFGMIFRMIRSGYSRRHIISEIQPLLNAVSSGFNQRGRMEYEPPHSVIYTDQTEFANMHLVEISRGCPGNCSFCMSKHLYRFYREFEYDGIIRAIDKAPQNIRTIGLIGDAVLSHSRIGDIVDYIVGRKKRPSFSSIRIADLTEEKIPLILKSEIKTLTIAPEVASEKLMKVTNKYYNRKRLFDTLKELIRNGIMNLKLYMMIGLPSETEEDIDEMINFIRETRDILIHTSKDKGRLGMLRVSVNNFVPSPFTPLFSQNPDEIESLEHKQLAIRKKVGGLSNLSLSFMDIFDTLYETALFRADYEFSKRILYIQDTPAKKVFEADKHFRENILRLCYR